MRTFAKAVITSFTRLECIARIRAELDSRSRQYRADAAFDTLDIDVTQAAMQAGEDPSAHSLPAGAGYTKRDAGCTGSSNQSGSGC